MDGNLRLDTANLWMMTDEKTQQVHKAMKHHQFKQIKRLFEVRHNGPNEMDNYLRGLVSHGVAEYELIKAIKEEREKGK